MTPDRTLTTVDALFEAGMPLAASGRAALEAVGRAYAIGVPASWAARIGDPDGPLARQVLPHADELATSPDEQADPTGDARWSPVPGVVRRYADRVLVKPILACPIYCRFCFRREHVGPDGGMLDDATLRRALDWIARETALREVILTGGDPLILSPRRLASIVAAIGRMRQIETVRIHTRLPVANPERVTDALLGALDTSKGMRIVLHANSADEITTPVRACIRRILATGIPVLSQSVLLRGVNDTPERLEALLRALLAARVTPTYLHQLDRAPGTARFHVPIEEGRALLAALRGRVPGDAWPTYVLDIEGGHGKVPIGPDYLDLGRGTVRDPKGATHSLAGRSGIG